MSFKINHWQVSQRWTATTLIGGSAGIVPGWLLRESPTWYDPVNYRSIVATVLLSCYLLGWLQSRALPFAVTPRSRWFFATVAGGIAGLLGVMFVMFGALGIQIAFGELPDPPFWTLTPATVVVACLVFGALLGVMQMLVLQEYAQHAWWWVGANAGAWGTGGILRSLLNATFDESFLAWFLALVPYAITTGMVLPKLVAKR